MIGEGAVHFPSSLRKKVFQLNRSAAIRATGIESLHLISLLEDLFEEAEWSSASRLVREIFHCMGSTTGPMRSWRRTDWLSCSFPTVVRVGKRRVTDTRWKAE